MALHDLSLRLLTLLLLLPTPSPCAPPQSAPANPPAPTYPTPQIARQHFELADRDMNVHWNSVRKTLPPNEYRLLQESQRRWALLRDEMSASPIYTATGGETRHRSNSGPFLQTAADLTEQRGKWLKGIADYWNQKDQLSGVWEDGEGGRLEILMNERHLAFSIETVRGVGSQTGVLTGTAAWDTRIGWHSDSRGNSFCLVLRQSRLELVTSGPTPYHQPEAGFDGNYYKTGELTGTSKETLKRLLAEPAQKPTP